jgi:biopolymer transport protein ExbB
VVAGPAPAQVPAGAPPAVAPAAQPEPAAADQPKELTLFELLAKGGSLMYPLYLCSIVMVAFIVERAISLRRGRVLPPATVDRLRSALSDSPGSLNTKELLEELQMQTNPIARVVTAGLRKAERTIPEIEKAIEDAGAKEVAKMQQNNRMLSNVASIAPLLGLLGTITGMISAFMTVAAKEEALGRTELLAAGIYEALVTTAAGLTIAIPALVFYFYYQERVEKLVTEIDGLAVELVEKLSAKI